MLGFQGSCGALGIMPTLRSIIRVKEKPCVSELAPLVSSAPIFFILLS